MSNLQRFKEAQARDYATALAEVAAGKKRSHWMWYIFPQIAGLGMTDTSRHYAIADIKEATDYLLDQELGYRLTEISKALLALESSDAHAVFGTPDDLKLRSCIDTFRGGTRDLSRFRPGTG